MIAFLLSATFLWVAFIALIILIAIFVELENARWASILTTLAIVFVLWRYKTEAWDFISTNPVNTISLVGGYILCGLIWSLFKWKIYISKSSKNFKRLKEGFISRNGYIGSNWKLWISYLEQNRTQLNYANFYERDEPSDIIRKITVDASEKKGVIISWIAYFPMSMAATFLNDPFRKFFSWLFELFSGVYSRMAKHEVAGLDTGMNKLSDAEQKTKK